MMNNIIKLVTLLSIILVFSCNNSDEEIERQQLNCLSVGLQNGVVAFYPFINGSLNDESGNNYNLVNTTSAIPGEDRNGNLDCAFQFNSSNNEFLEYTDPTFLDNFHNSPYSISLWYKPTGLNWNYETLIGRTYSSGCQFNSIYGQWAILLFDCRRANFEVDGISIWDGYFNTNGCDDTTSDLSNIWQHLVVSYDGVNNVELYRNGILTTDSQLNWNSSCRATGILGDLFVGKNYTGSLDDIIIYNRLLSSLEISELYSLNPCCN